MIPAIPEPAKPLKNFYASVLDDTEALAAAHEIEGFDEELAMLRARLKERLKERLKKRTEEQIDDRPQDDQLMLRSVTLIIRAVAARYRMSEKNARDLTESAVNTLKLLAEEVMPPREEDV